MILETSTYGLGKALIKGLKVFFWVVGSSAVGTGLIFLVQSVHSFGIGHPEYVVYTGAVTAALNSLGVIISHWLTQIRPEGAPTVNTAEAQIG